MAVNQTRRFFVITETQTCEEVEVDFAKLVGHLAKNNWLDDIRKGDIVTNNGNHLAYISKVTTDDLPNQNLPDGHYRIKGFEGVAERE